MTTRYGLNPLFHKAFAHNEVRERCFYCDQLAVIPGMDNRGTKDYILIHNLLDGSECPMSELQRDLDQMTFEDIAEQDEEWEHYTEAPLE